MKIAFYIDPLISPRSTFYTKILLQQHLRKLGHRMDLYIPQFKLSNPNIKDCYVDRKFAKQHKYSIHWEIPNSKKYDVLIVVNIWSKKWHHGKDFRQILAQDFHRAGKKVICLKNDTTLEHRFVDFKTIYGVNTFNSLKIKPRWRLPKDTKKGQIRKFLVPQLSSYHFEKPKALSRDHFYRKYRLDPKHKLIIFFSAAYKKWGGKPSKHVNLQSIHWFYSNARKIDVFLKTKGYQLIYKSHRRDHHQVVSKFSYSGMTIIDPYDTYEAILYADRALATHTSMIYELYLYNLPVLELNGGGYYPGWMSDLAKKKFGREHPLKKYDQGRSLIYGMVTNYGQLQKKYQKIFSKFLKKKFTLKKYKYLKNHPIYGNSYQASMKTIARAIIQAIEKMK